MDGSWDTIKAKGYWIHGTRAVRELNKIGWLRWAMMFQRDLLVLDGLLRWNWNSALNCCWTLNRREGVGWITTVTRQSGLLVVVVDTRAEAGCDTTGMRTESLKWNRDWIC